jgi:hypothetical protein
MWKLGVRPRNSFSGNICFQISESCLCSVADKNWAVAGYTAKTVYRKFETNITRNETARPQSQSYIHVSVSDLYISTIGLPIVLQENRWTDRGNK